MRKKTMNRKGGAALAAILILIILLASGMAIMVVTGRGTIDKASNVPILSNDSSKPDESKPDEKPAETKAPDESQPPEDESKPEEIKTISIPKEAADYKKIDPKADNINAKYAILVDVDNNEIIAGYDYDKRMFPASLTKIMTIIVANENVKDKSVKYKFTDKELTPLYEEKASVVGFEPGETVTFDDLMYGAVLRSGADATVGLANLTAGSEKKFVELMNKKAEEMGLKDTHFSNSSGLHNDKNYSTCRDMAVILEYAMKTKPCHDALCAKSYTTSKTAAHPEGITLSSIVSERTVGAGYYIDADGDGEEDADTEILGGKTGFMDEAKYVLATQVEKAGRNYICVTALSATDKQATIDSLTIYEKYMK